jgi:uncharacterized protein involved in exopolysaccharide biosynthesis
MLEEQNIGAKSDNDEVSLIDLLAVFVRYRKLLLWLPIVVTLAVGIIVYLPSLITQKAAERTYSAQIRASIDLVPVDIQGYIDIDMIRALNSDFYSTQFVLGSFSKIYDSRIENMKSEDVNAYMQKSILGSKLKGSYDPSIGVYTLSFSDSEQDKAALLVSDLWARSIAGIRERIAGKYAIALEILKQQLDIYDAGGKIDSATVMSKATLLSAYKKLLKYQAMPQSPFGGDQKVQMISLAGKPKSNKVIISFFGSLLVAVLLAFLLNMASRIRRTPKEMAKLKAAIDDGWRLIKR